MPPVTIPFARKEAYRNPEYTRAMADLMIQKSQEDARLRLARGQSVSNAWGQFGNVVMSSLTDIAQKRALDEKVARDLKQQNIENVRANVTLGIQQKQLEDAAEERKLARQRQERLDREELGKQDFEMMSVGDETPAEGYAYANTAAGRRLQRLPAMEERLPATPIIESGGIPSYTNAQGGEDYLIGPRRRTMSQDTAARPERLRRNPTQAEAIQIDTAARLQAQQEGLEWNRLRDDERQRRRDIAEDDYRTATLDIRRQQAANAGQGAQPQILEAGGQFYRVPRPGGPAEPVMGPDGQPLTKFAGTDGMGAMRNLFDRAIGNVSPSKRAPLVERGQRLMAEGNTEEVKSVIRQAVIESTPVDMQTQVVGRMGTIAALKDAQATLQQLAKAGVPTNMLTGTVEDIYRKLGTSSNPEYVALSNQLGTTLMNYRRSMTGAAFSASEGADYEKMFPGYRTTMPVNEAQISGLLRAMSVYDNSFWSMKLGPEGAALLGYGPPAPYGAGGGGAGGKLGTITKDANGNIVVK